MANTGGSTNVYDVVVLGQGLAGTAAAWALHWAGLRVLIIDRGDPHTPSRVAAGLMTPITGQRLVPSWRWHEFWSTAVDFYQRVSEITGTRCLRPVTMLRLFADEREQQRFAERCQSPEFRALATETIAPALEPSLWHAEFGGFMMPAAGQLDVSAYLDASRRWFLSQQALLEVELQPESDLVLTSQAVELPRFGLTARDFVFADGLASEQHPWLHGVRFLPARGDILTIRLPGLTERRIVHRGVWLAPVEDDVFRVGATYDWKRRDAVPCPLAREELLQRLSRLVKMPSEVLDQTAAVRPILQQPVPVIGRVPGQPRLAVLNGLGSKGSLQAPWCAGQLVRALLHESTPDTDVDVAHRWNP